MAKIDEARNSAVLDGEIELLTKWIALSSVDQRLATAIEAVIRDRERLIRKLRDLSSSESVSPGLVHIGTSCLTRDLVWCECGRGLSLTGKWLFCPNCGRPLDQDSYHAAVEQAKLNGAVLYRDMDVEAARATPSNSQVRPEQADAQQDGAADNSGEGEL